MWVACPVSADCCYCRQEKKGDWDWLLGAYCICLQESEDRFESSQQCFHQTGLCQRAVYYRPTRATCSLSSCMSPGEYGCWQSHATVNGMHISEVGSVLVLEDDVVCIRSGNICQKQQCTGELLYLGGSPMFGWPIESGLWKSFVLCTEAYVTSQSARCKIICEFDEGIPSGYQIDQFLARRCRQYFVYPPLFSQLPDNTSSIGYGGLMTKCMHFRTRLPRFTAACMLSIIPTLVVVAVLLCLLLFLTR